MEEQFFFRYHMNMSREEFRSYPINERKWMIERFVEQKSKEHDAIEKEKRKKH
jgi:hypothetical protein